MAKISPEQKKLNEEFVKAIRQGEDDKAISLVKQGADVNTPGGLFNETPLHWVTFTGNIKMVQFLLENGANVNALDKEGNTPFLTACRGDYHDGGYLEMANLLLKNGADASILKTHRGYEPLSVAASMGEVELTEFLIENGAGVHAKDPYIMVNACWMRQPETVKLLIKNGANVNAKGDRSETPLHAVCGHCDYVVSARKGVEVVKLLLQNGADVNALDEQGRMPLDNLYDLMSSSEAKEEFAEYKEMEKILFKNGAKATVPMDEYFVEAVYSGNVEAVEFFMSKGADVNAKNARGLTVLDFVQDLKEKAETKEDYAEYDKIEKLLREKGAKTKDEFNKKSPLEADRKAKSDASKTGKKTSSVNRTLSSAEAVDFDAQKQVSGANKALKAAEQKTTQKHQKQTKER